MVEFLPIVTTVGTAIGVIWGVVEIRRIIKSGREVAENRIITAMDTRLDSIKTKISDNEKSFITHVTEKEKLMNQLKDDIHKLEEHLQALCNTVSKHDATITMQTPIINQVQQSITELKVKVELMEKGIKL